MSIRKLSIIIGVIGVDLAVCRFIGSRSPYYGPNKFSLIAVVPIGLTLQLAFYRVVGTRERDRVFWLGSLTFGVAAMASIILYLSDPPTETTTYSISRGTRVEIDPGGPMTRLWVFYINLVYSWLQSLGYPYAEMNDDWPSTSTDAVLLLLPQLLIALGGGSLARLLAPSPPNTGSVAAGEREG